MRNATASTARRRKTRRKATGSGQVTALNATDEVAVYIAAWTPKRGQARDQWPSTAAVVRDLVTKAQPGGVEIARKYLGALARHAAARAAAGMRVDDGVELLSDDALAATLGTQAKSGLSENSRRTHLAHLRRVRSRALPNEYGQAKELTGLDRSPVAEPYTDADIAALLTWCRTSGHAKAARLHAAALLALACGIDGFEAGRVTGEDVVKSPWGLVVSAPGMAKGGTRPARPVPVLAAYERDLARLAAKCGSGLLLGDGTRGLHDLTSGTRKTPSVPAFNAGRARATWTRTLLIAGASVVALRQAGVSTRSNGPLHTLCADLSLPMADLVTMLRDSDEPFNPDDPDFAGLGEWAEQ